MFVIYHRETTRRLDMISRNCNKEKFKTIAAAKAALTRACNKDVTLLKNEFEITDGRNFYDNIQKTEIVINLMSGKPVVQSVNTPRCCDVSSELYWSM